MFVCTLWSYVSGTVKGFSSRRDWRLTLALLLTFSRFLLGLSVLELCLQLLEDPGKSKACHSEASDSAGCLQITCHEYGNGTESYICRPKQYIWTSVLRWLKEGFCVIVNTLMQLYLTVHDFEYLQEVCMYVREWLSSRLHLHRWQGCVDSAAGRQKGSPCYMVSWISTLPNVRWHTKERILQQSISTNWW